MLLTFCVALIAASLTTFLITGQRRRSSSQREPRRIGVGILLLPAILAVAVALDVTQWDAVALGAGTALGILLGQWLAARRTQTPV
ncbi:MAG: hypothetical protein QOJ63_1306 [Solirubrobacteraceae bacterium]|nr:hypothetical protein [Solirubrobacteraceae bacterium]